MDIEDSAEGAAFRGEVRAFVSARRDELSIGRGAAPERVPDLRRAQALLHSAGLVGVTWPVEYGGRGGTPVQKVIVEQELDRAEVPRLIGWIGVGMCGPAIMAHGTEEQKRRYLTPMLNADEVWCQLFSEPGAGSDLAALSTRAVRDGDGWRISGQKVWTTGAQWCDYGILLARTDPSKPKHRGLTMFLLDMRAPGLTVRPLREMTGAAVFNEVFLDDVPVPDSARLGEIDGGWAVALTVLMNERYSVGGDGTVYGAGPDALTRAVADALPGLGTDRRAEILQEYAACWIEGLACRMTGNRMLTALSEGREPGPEGSAGKLASSALLKRAADLGLCLQGDDALFGASAAGDGTWQGIATFAPGISLAGGTTEVMKNILGERVLGLPPEPRLDKAAAATGGKER
ncbi:acyl-CoA dehydrogenase family protein [Spirillospora sp. NPDC048819]|uniref:acyl-CoA dehydrogenase family protein n=1 Tax=Spirillospora sp. NPDC048819 TaxID=3155268 RepID=UPI0033E05D37